MHANYIIRTNEMQFVTKIQKFSVHVKNSKNVVIGKQSFWCESQTKSDTLLRCYVRDIN